MDDPLLSSMKINWIETVYFYLFLPLVTNHCHFEPGRLKLWKALQLRQSSSVFDIPEELSAARARVDKITPDHFIYKGKEKLNPKALEYVDSIDEIYQQLETGSKILSGYTNDVLKRIEELES